VGKSWFIINRQYRWTGRRPRRWLPRGKSFFYVLTPRWEFGMRALSGRGICCVERWPRGTRLGALVAHAPRTWEYPDMKRPKTAAATDAVHIAALETEVFADLLPLVEHMAVRRYEDGTPREPGWVTIKTAGAAWVVQVKDPESCCSFSAVGDTLDKALGTAALLLSCDEAPWEQDQWLQQSRAKRNKK